MRSYVAIFTLSVNLTFFSREYLVQYETCSSHISCSYYMVQRHSIYHVYTFARLNLMFDKLNLLLVITRIYTINDADIKS